MTTALSGDSASDRSFSASAAVAMAMLAIGIGLAAVPAQGAAAQAVLVLDTRGTEPSRLACRDAAAAADAVAPVVIPAPSGGWSGAPFAVLAVNALDGEVRIGFEGREVCARQSDARSLDTRFHSGIGAVFVPQAGSTEPLRIELPAALSPLWLPVVQVGHPEPLQRDDFARWMIRIFVLSAVLANAISALMAFVVTRSAAFALFALTSLTFAFWCALVSGAAAQLFPWLPLDAALAPLLVGLPLLSGGVTVRSLVKLGRLDRSFDWLDQWSRRLVLGAVPLGLLAMVMPREQLPLVSVVVELGILAILGALLLLALLAWQRGRRGALAVAAAVLPFVLAEIATLVWGATLATWKLEAMIASGAWVVLATNAVMTLRLGDLREQRDRLRELANTDPLTGLLNRRGGLLLLERMLSESVQRHRRLSVAYIDLDHFKAVNDRHGHAVGDQVLQMVGERVCSSLRGSDVIARLGGEEFLLVLSDASGANALRLVDTLRARIAERPLMTRVGPIPVTVSVGICALEHGPLGAPELLARADQAMYAAKRHGRNCVVLWPDEAPTPSVPS